MKKILLMLAISINLTACTYFSVHKIDIEQGNIITAEKADQLHTGMTKAQVEKVLGTPLLANTFTPDRIDYVYTFKSGTNPMIEKHIGLIFKNGRIIQIEREPIRTQ